MSRHFIPMKFKDGDGGRRMKKEFVGKSTVQLIIEGHRTGTTRDISKSYNKYDIKVGDYIQFYSNFRRIVVIVTKAPYNISEISKKEWSDLECWEESVYDKLTKQYQQYQFKLIP